MDRLLSLGLDAELLVPEERDISHPDCAFLLSEEGQQSLVDLHVDGICAYLASL